MTTLLTLETIRRAPKALLHDHLDGGLRPSTVIDIAGRIGYDGLPSTDEAELAAWFRNAAHSGPEYHLVRSVVEMAYRQRSEARGARRGYVDPSDGAYARVVEKLREEVGVL